VTAVDECDEDVVPVYAQTGGAPAGSCANGTVVKRYVGAVRVSRSPSSLSFALSVVCTPVRGRLGLKV
jgi:hypothetical protein